MLSIHHSSRWTRRRLRGLFLWDRLLPGWRMLRPEGEEFWTCGT